MTVSVTRKFLESPIVLTPEPSAHVSKTFDGLRFFVHSYHTIAQTVRRAGGKTDQQVGKLADVLVLGGHHYGRYKDMSGRFVRDGKVWWLHKEVSAKTLKAAKVVAISGCSSLNLQSMHYYAKHCPNAIVLGSGMGVDSRSRAGTLIEAFWKWLPNHLAGKPDLSTDKGRTQFKKLFEQFVALHGGKSPGEVEGFGWFDARTGVRRIFMYDRRHHKGRWITKDYSEALPKRNPHAQAASRCK